VGVDHAGRGVEAGIGDAHDAGLAVVAGHVVEKEFECVVHVGAFVDIFRRFFYVDVRAHLDEGAFGHVAAADILIDEDIASLFKFIRWAEVLPILVFAVRVDAVGRAGDEEGVCLAAVLRHVDGGEETHSVAHGDAACTTREAAQSRNIRRNFMGGISFFCALIDVNCTARVGRCLGFRNFDSQLLRMGLRMNPSNRRNPGCRKTGS
jgi:hypothetical protein